MPCIPDGGPRSVSLERLSQAESKSRAGSNHKETPRSDVERTTHKGRMTEARISSLINILLLRNFVIACWNFFITLLFDNCITS